MLLVASTIDLSDEGFADKSLMSDQTLMEILFSDPRVNQRFKTEEGTFLPLDEWDSIRLNSQGKVTEISFCNSEHALLAKSKDTKVPNGSMCLRWLPPKTRRVHITRYNLEGTVETANLPENMDLLNLFDNLLSGTFIVDNLPRRMKNVNISLNTFHGSLNISALPPLIQRFSAIKNKFSGTLDFGNLPRTIEYLGLSQNVFCGPLRVSKIPDDCESIELFKNSFDDGIAVIDVLPSRLQYVKVDLKFHGRVKNLYGQANNSLKIIYM